MSRLKASFFVAVVASLLMLGVAPVQAQEAVVLANDGMSLSGESAQTRAVFAAVYGGQAASRWASEHNAQLAIGAPVRPFRIVWESLTSVAANEVTRTAFIQGLRDLGYRPGNDILIDWRYLDGQNDQIPKMVADVVASQADLIVAGGGTDGLAFKGATSTIPIIFNTGTDPVGVGMVRNLEHPGGNVTGMQNNVPDLYPRTARLVKEVMPNAKRLGVMFNPESTTAPTSLRLILETAEPLGLQIQAFELRASSAADAAANGIPAAVDAAASAGVDGLLVIGDTGLVNPNQKRISDLAIQKRLPLLTISRTFVDNGALFSNSSNPIEVPTRTAGYVDKILKGAKPDDLPVGIPNVVEIAVNLKTAQSIGITIPDALLQKATDIVR
jgi:putative tryptophan/tyrosine transport system substrate-binding protein